MSLMSLMSLPSLAGLASAVPPFSVNLLQDAQVMLSFDFMRAAFLAGTFVAIMAGVVGYFIVLRQQVFAGEQLSHVAFACVLGATLVNLNFFAGLFGGTVLVALLIGALSGRVRPRDSEIGVVSAWVLGLGVLFLSIYISGGIQGTTTHTITIGVSTLFGTIVGLDASTALVMALVGAGITVVMLLIARPLLFASLDPEVALAKGVPVKALGILFLVLVALSVSEATEAVGALLILTLLVTPAAIARRVCARPAEAIAVAALLALAFVWIGLVLAFYIHAPYSFLITTLAFGTLVLVEGALWLGSRRLFPPWLRNPSSI
jgi:zinc/manganese transport system permease protein